MGLTNEHVGTKILAKIKIYVLTRAELHITLCYEIPVSFTVVRELWDGLMSKQRGSFENTKMLKDIWKSIFTNINLFSLAAETLFFWFVSWQKRYIYQDLIEKKLKRAKIKSRLLYPAMFLWRSLVAPGGAIYAFT